MRYEVDDQPSFIVLRRLITFMCSEVMIACLDPFPGIGAINSGISIQGNIAVKLFTNERPFTGNVPLLHHQHTWRGGAGIRIVVCIYLPPSGMDDTGHFITMPNEVGSNYKRMYSCSADKQAMFDDLNKMLE